MDERQFNAIRSCELSAAKIAKKYGWDTPHFYLPFPGDNAIEFWRSAEALSIFLAQVAGVDEVSADATDRPVVPRPAESDDFTQVSGISAEIQNALYDAGYITWDDILTAGVINLREVSGVGMRRAQALFKMAMAEAE